jgi:hypothetical protein
MMRVTLQESLVVVAQKWFVLIVLLLEDYGKIVE